jgi:hypothetical protein
MRPFAIDGQAAYSVPSMKFEWRARTDSNRRPPGSKTRIPCIYNALKNKAFSDSSCATEPPLIAAYALETIDTRTFNSTLTRGSLRNCRGGSVSLKEKSVRRSRQLAPSYPFLPTVQLHEESCEERPRVRNRALNACRDVDPAPSICRGPQHCAPQ